MKFFNENIENIELNHEELFSGVVAAFVHDKKATSTVLFYLDFH